MVLLEDDGATGAGGAAVMAVSCPTWVVSGCRLALVLKRAWRSWAGVSVAIVEAPGV